MKKVDAILCVLAVVTVAALTWLYMSFGLWALIGAVALLGFAVYQLANNRDVQAAIDADASGVPSDEEFKRRGWQINDWFNCAVLTSAINGQEGWDVARWKLQKVAYSIARPEVKQAQKDWFREFMTRFASLDPVYQETIGRVKRLVRDQPGIMQSEIYKGRTEKEKEAARYILYFAAELDDIRREKAGRSYRLYLPDEAPQTVLDRKADV